MVYNVVFSRQLFGWTCVHPGLDVAQVPQHFQLLHWFLDHVAEIFYFP